MVIYVVETNILQRSFSDMLESEKAAVLSLQHSKLFSQGKRNDIIAALKKLENPHSTSENSTFTELRKSSNTRQTLAEEYGLKPNRIALYLRVNKLINSLKIRLDNNELPLSVAADLSFLRGPEQKAIDKCIELNGFKVDVKKATAVRGYSESGKLNEDNIYLILSGELSRSPQKKRTPSFRIRREVYTKYFSPGQKASEIVKIIEKALEAYFEQTQQELPAPCQSDDVGYAYDGDNEQEI